MYSRNDFNRSINQITLSRSSSNTHRNRSISLRNLTAATRAEPAQNNMRGTRAKADARNARKPRETQTHGTCAYY